jgi:hypothetical protein
MEEDFVPGESDESSSPTQRKLWLFKCVLTQQPILRLRRSQYKQIEGLDKKQIETREVFLYKLTFEPARIPPSSSGASHCGTRSDATTATALSRSGRLESIDRFHLLLVRTESP